MLDNHALLYYILRIRFTITLMSCFLSDTDVLLRNFLNNSKSRATLTIYTDRFPIHSYRSERRNVYERFLFTPNVFWNARRWKRRCNSLDHLFQHFFRVPIESLHLFVASISRSRTLSTRSLKKERKKGKLDVTRNPLHSTFYTYIRSI